MKSSDGRGVSKSFGGLKAVSRATFALAEGEVLGLIGPNGAGKTTLFHLISGFLRPDEGRRPVRPGRTWRAFGRTISASAAWCERFRSRGPFPPAECDRECPGRRHGARGASARALAIAEEVLALTGLAEKGGQMGHSLTLADRKRLELARALATRTESAPPRRGPWPASIRRRTGRPHRADSDRPRARDQHPSSSNT